MSARLLVLTSRIVKDQSLGIGKVKLGSCHVQFFVSSYGYKTRIDGPLGAFQMGRESYKSYTNILLIDEHLLPPTSSNWQPFCAHIWKSFWLFFFYHLLIQNKPYFLHYWCRRLRLIINFIRKVFFPIKKKWQRIN